MSGSNKFDVVVVGAGTAGCLVSMVTSKAGLSTCLVERKGRQEVGEKVCGDAMGDHHLKEVGLEQPKSGELEKKIEGVRIFSPNRENVFTIEHEDFVGHLLNRRLFGQWLLNKAINVGTTLMDSTYCLKPTVENKRVTGITAKDAKTSKRKELKARVVVDASGFVAVIRKHLPKQLGIDNDVANEDVEACYREIRQLKEETENTSYCEIYLNQKVSPGGYTWIFPKGGARVNVGLGICMRENFPNPKKQFYSHVASRPSFDGSLLLSAGAWYDPTRRPLDTMTGDGVVILGDAACLVNPVHGGGIGPSMLSGRLAGETIVEALADGDAGKESLWSYNLKYNKAYGAKQAALDVFRKFLLTAGDGDLDYGMKYHLLTEDDVLKAAMGDTFHLKIGDKTQRVFKGLRKIRFLNKLRLTVNMMRQIREHYSRYPETPDNFERWRMQTLKLFKEADSKIVHR